MYRILLMEDDDAVTEPVVGHLLDAGYEVLATGEGRTGVELVESSRPHLGIVDLRVPESLATIRLLRRTHPEVPILALAPAEDGADPLAEARRHGASAGLEVPFTIAELLLTVGGLVSP